MGLTDIDFIKFQNIASEAILQAKDILLYYFRNYTISTDNKTITGWDPVTIADKEAEKKILSVIKNNYPTHDICAEETGYCQKGSDFQWVIDPIDGTKAYLLGLPIWGTLIGLTYQEKPLFGCVAQPFIQEYFFGDSHTAFHLKEQKKSRLSLSMSQPKKNLNTLKMVCTTPDMFLQSPQNQWFERLRSSVMTVRYGTDCYGYLSIAMGVADFLFEADLAPYDYLPLLPIITGAGGVYKIISLPDQAKDMIIAAQSQHILNMILEFLDIA